MENVLIIRGSADDNGVTERMCRIAEAVMASKGMRVEVIRPSQMDIGHCTGCDSCRSGGCIIDDDMIGVYEAFSKADTLILASPIHFSGPSSLIKTVMDRFQPYWFDRRLGHPGRVYAMLCGGGPAPRFDNTLSIFRAFAITIGMDWAGDLEISGTDDGIDPQLEKKIADLLR